MLLRHRAQVHAATAIERGIAEMLKQPKTRTKDLGGPLGTKAFAVGLSHLLETME